MRRSNSWSESYEDFAVTDDITELAATSKDSHEKNELNRTAW